MNSLLLFFYFILKLLETNNTLLYEAIFKYNTFFLGLNKGKLKFLHQLSTILVENVNHKASFGLQDNLS